VHNLLWCAGMGNEPIYDITRYVIMPTSSFVDADESSAMLLKVPGPSYRWTTWYIPVPATCDGTHCLSKGGHPKPASNVYGCNIPALD
jgi:hypothetical protein